MNASENNVTYYKSTEESSSKNRVSIILTAYNKTDYTIQCIQSVLANSTNVSYDLIVVNNGSTDDTLQQLQPYRLKANIVSIQENIGFVGACNLGASYSSTEYLVFLSNDTQVLPNWLAELVGVLDSESRAGVAGAKLLYPNGLLQDAGGIVWHDGSAENYGRFDRHDKPDFSFIREVDYVTGACFIIRQSLFTSIGGFDVRYSPGYYEDTDLCFEVRARGYTVLYHPRSVVIHHEGITAGTDVTTGMKRFQPINKEKFVEKWAAELARHPVKDPIRMVRFSSRATAKRLLVIDPIVPMHDRAAGSHRLFLILKILRAQGAFVTFIARDWIPHNRYVDDLERMGVEVFSVDRRKQRELGRYVPNQNIDLAELLSTREYDLAWLSFYHVAEQYLPEIRFHAPSLPIIVDSVDLHFMRESRMATLSGRQDLLDASSKTRARELAIYSAADLVVTVSETDGQILKDIIPSIDYRVIPIIQEKPSNFRPFNERDGLLFIGNFNHLPNVDAVNYFVQSIFPRVTACLPDLKFYVVGHGARDVLHVEGTNVIVVGPVEKTDPFIQAARVSIAPIRFGSGVKGKIGEAMMGGLPVCTTLIGAEGMDLMDGETAMIADSPTEFADKVVRLYSDRSLWEKLSSAGISHAATRYSPDAVKHQLDQLLLSVQRRTESPNGGPR